MSALRCGIVLLLVPVVSGAIIIFFDSEAPVRRAPGFELAAERGDRDGLRLLDEASYKGGWKEALARATPAPPLDPTSYSPVDRVEALAMRKEGVERILSGQTRRMSPREAYRLVDAADVILVGDNHACPGVLRSLACLLVESSESEVLRSGDCALGLECAPASEQERWTRINEELVAGDHAPLEAAISRLYPWPTSEYLRSIPLLCERGVRLLAIGKYDQQETPAERTHAWLETPGRKGSRKIFILYGLNHLLGGQDCLQARLTDMGHVALVLVVGDVAWDRALFARFGDEACAGWFEVFPGVLRAPPAADALDTIYVDVRDSDPKRDESRRWVSEAQWILERAGVKPAAASRAAVLREIAIYESRADKIRRKLIATKRREEIARIADSWKSMRREYESRLGELLPVRQAEAVFAAQRVPWR